MLRLQALLLIVLTLLLTNIARGEEMPVTSGDRLTVTVTGEAELTGTYTVDQDGHITVPMIGKLVVKGMAPAKVREELTTRLAKYVRDPQVRVEFMERAQITVGFTGSVAKAGPVKLKKGSRLLDGLAEAQGLGPDADPQGVRLQRRSGTVMPLDLSKLLSGDPKLNVELEEGDSVFVPRIAMNTIRVLGAVNKPGDLQRKENITVLEAVLAGGGLTPDADRTRAQILRRDQAQPEFVNLDAVLTGAAPNLPLKDGDTLTVPGIQRIVVKVFGLVGKPGESEMKVGTTVIEALTAAGGFAPEADKRSVLLTTKDGEPKRLMLDRVDSPDGALKLESGMQLYVPKETPRRFAVAGGVNEPGVFPFPDDPKQKVYLTDALATAKGPVERAKKKTLVVIRKNPNGGQPIPIAVDFEALLKKKDPALNLEILINDVVYVDVEPERSERRKPLEQILGIAGALFGF